MEHIQICVVAPPAWEQLMVMILNFEFSSSNLMTAQCVEK